jgi:SAM-dependent methyltransferase
VSSAARLDFRQRATEPESLDVGVSEDEARRSLADLRFVNRWLGGRRALLRAVRPYLGPGARLLDVGCGSADLPAFVLRATGHRLRVVGLDLKLVHLREAAPGVLRVAADVRRLPFPERSFDVVTASLFLHHFDAPELPGVLRSLFALSRRALVVNDLRRARLPYAFSRLVFPFVFKSPVSISDGLISIRRGFTDDELHAGFVAAGLEHVRIVRRFPYRLVAVAEAA